jgi:hypothetical protein
MGHPLFDLSGKSAVVVGGTWYGLAMAIGWRRRAPMLWRVRGGRSRWMRLRRRLGHGPPGAAVDLGCGGPGGPQALLDGR